MYKEQMFPGKSYMTSMVFKVIMDVSFKQKKRTLDGICQHQLMY